MKKLIFNASLIVAMLTMLPNCADNKKAAVDKAQKSIKEKAENINSDFRKIRLEVAMLATEIQKLYENQDRILPGIDQSKYQIENNGVMTKTRDDGGSAVFVSGFYPINEYVKRAVYFTEPIDPVFKSLVKKYPEIVQVYYNDQYSLNRIYPFFDVLSQYEAKMDIPSFNFYYLADQKHNPQKKSLWISEPYVDPAGRGWMVSAIAPVYYQNKLVGVPGIDVTINTITKRYVQDSINSMTLIVDKNGAIVAAQEATINLLSFPPLFDHKYIETIKQDTYRKDSYNLKLSKELNVRKIATQIIDQNKGLAETEINGEKLTVVAAHIDELNWYILEIVR